MLGLRYSESGQTEIFFAASQANMSSAAAASAVSACSSVDLGQPEKCEQPAVAPSVSSGPDGPSGPSDQNDRKNAAGAGDAGSEGAAGDGAGGSRMPESHAQAPRKRNGFEIPSRYALHLYDKALKSSIEAECAYYRSAGRSGMTFSFSEYKTSLEEEMQDCLRSVKRFGNKSIVGGRTFHEVKSDFAMESEAWTMAKSTYKAKADKIRLELAKAEEAYRIVDLIETAITSKKIADQANQEQLEAQAAAEASEEYIPSQSERARTTSKAFEEFKAASVARGESFSELELGSFFLKASLSMSNRLVDRQWLMAYLYNVRAREERPLCAIFDA